jgi:ribose 5-phosphate isomerase A
MSSDELRQQAAAYAVDNYIESGMVVGLGVGRTVNLALHHLAKRLEAGTVKEIIGIPCSDSTAQLAQQLGIPLSTLEAHPIIDVTLDGADEVDPFLNLIKGGGGALLREKVVAQASLREVIMIDPSKQVTRLGTNWALPIEILPFSWGSEALFLRSLGADPKLRLQADGQPFVTDNGHHIVDAQFGPLDHPAELAHKLDGRAGIMEHGLFIGLATDVIVARTQGIQVLHRKT